MDSFRNAPVPPYYAVIFFAGLTGNTPEDYKETGRLLFDMARQQPGFLGYEELDGDDEHSFNVSYWDSLDAIRQWRQQVDHREAQRRGKSEWYEWFEVRIARVERAYSFSAADQ